MTPETVLVAIELVLGFAATFFGVLLWSLTRDSAWMLVIIATVVRFGEAVFRTLDLVGVFSIGGTVLFGIPFFWAVLKGTAWLLLLAGFAIMVQRNRV